MVTAELGNYLATALDPTLLMSDLGMVPDPWQARAVRSRSDRLLLLASRQSGKSTVTSCIALHNALFNPESLTLLFAQASDNRGNFF